MQKDQLPAPEVGLVLTHFLTVRDVARSRDWYAVRRTPPEHPGNRSGRAWPCRLRGVKRFHHRGPRRSRSSPGQLTPAVRDQSLRVMRSPSVVSDSFGGRGETTRTRTVSELTLRRERFSILSHRRTKGYRAVGGNMVGVCSLRLPMTRAWRATGSTLQRTAGSSPLLGRGRENDQVTVRRTWRGCLEDRGQCSRRTTQTPPPPSWVTRR
jgi:hypothetical protein